MSSLKNRGGSLRILVATDKFKGSLTAAEAVDAICLGLEQALPEARLHKLALADGGEGTVELFVKSFGGQIVECDTTDALGRPLRARYGWTPSQHQAVIEMNAAAGLAQIPEGDRDVLRASTFGVGTMMIDAARRGARRIVVGLGGSATNDAGVGLAAALGYRFLDVRGSPLTPVPRNLPEIHRIERARRVFTPEVVAVSDVQNPLLGPTGSARIYGPQKGADAATIEVLERNVAHLLDLVRRDLHCDFHNVPGAGAAGGLGFGLLTFCQATLRSGFDTFADLLGLDRLIHDVDLVITGEGSLDPQTLDGKGPGGVARRAKALGKPVIAFAGRIAGEPLLEPYFDAAFSIASGPLSPLESMRDARLLLVRAAERVGRVIAFSREF